MSSNTTMDSFFSRIVGRIGHHNKKKRHSLQENSLSVSTLSVDADVTSPDIMESNVERISFKRHSYIDWSRDDAINNDVIAKNIDNHRDSNQWKRSKKPLLDNRKLSFGLFKKNKDQAPRESVKIEEDLGLDRRPKRYFSQQNLKSVSADEESCNGHNNRFNPPRFLWRFRSNQRFQSNQDLTSSSSVNQSQVNQQSSSPGVAVEDKNRTSATTTATSTASSSHTESTWTGCGLEQRNRCQSMSGLPEIPASSDYRHPNNSYYFQQQRQRPNCLGSEFPSTRCLGEYRPGLNTHYEEPLGNINGENDRPRIANSEAQDNWSSRTLKQSSRAPGLQQEMRIHSRPSSSDELEQTWKDEPSRSTSIIEDIQGQNVESRFKGFPDGNVGRSVAVTSPMRSHYRPPLQNQQHEYPPTPTVTRNEPVLCDNRGNFAVEELGNVRSGTLTLQYENHVTKMRRLSQELYAQNKPTSPTTILPTYSEHQPKKDSRQMDLPAGYPSHYQRSLKACDQSNEASTYPSRPGTFRQFHSRSQSMSQLQGDFQPSTTTDREWLVRSTLNFATTEVKSKSSGSTGTGSGDYDLIGDERFKFSGFNAQPKPVLSSVVYHQRGGSLDSSVAGRAAYERTLSGGPSVVASKRISEDNDLVFSGAEVSGSAKRSSGDDGDERTSDYRTHHHQTCISGFDGERERNAPSSMQAQQQAMVNLFQKLNLLRQQKQLSTTGFHQIDSKEEIHQTSSQGHECPSGSESLNSLNRLPYIQKRPVLLSDATTQCDDDSKDTSAGVDHASLKAGCGARGGDADGGKAPMIDSCQKSCHPRFHYQSNSEDYFGKKMNAHCERSFDVGATGNHGIRQEVMEQQRTIELGQGQRSPKIDVGSEQNLLSIAAEQTDSFPPSHPPPPPALPPKPHRPLPYSVGLRDDLKVAEVNESGSSEVIDFYADRLRQEARKHTTKTTTNSTRSSYGSDGNSGGGSGGGSGDGGSDGDVGLAVSVHGEVASSNSESPGTSAICRIEEVGRFEDVFTAEGKLFNTKSSTTTCESFHRDLSFGGNRDHHKGDLSKPVNSRSVGHTKIMEVDQDRAAFNCLSNKIASRLPVKAATTGLSNNLEANGSTVCQINCYNSKLSSSSSSCLNNRQPTLSTNRDCSTASRQHSGCLSHIFRELSVDKPSSVDDEDFRSLAGAFCRTLKGEDLDISRTLKPVCVRASANFVRQVFEGQRSPDFDGSFQAIVDLRSEMDLESESSCDDELRKGSEKYDESLKTLKDQLLALVEKRLKRETENNQQLELRHQQTVLLENEVREIVRRKIDSKQFEKFLSYLEQLEKVVQLLLNLSARLSGVEEAICQNQADHRNEKEQRCLGDKRLQIVQRIKEAIDLKGSIDKRSDQMFLHLSQILTEIEFDDFRLLIRNKCHLLMQRQTTEEHKQQILLQKKILISHCQDDRSKEPTDTCSNLDLILSEMINT